MRIVFFGCTKFSEYLLKNLLAKNHSVVGVFSIPKEFNISYSNTKVKNSNYADLEILAKKNHIPHFEVDSVSGKKISDYSPVIKKLKPDVILVLGWYYMVPKVIRDIPKHGAWGIHASLLPKYAGGAPLVWSIIEGEKETGVTLFRMDSGVDDGDIIAQKKFSILENDTIKEVYEKAGTLSIKILDETLNSNNIQFIPQDKNNIELYPQRSPEDGLIDWSWGVKRIKNFIRAQTKPYPGAFTILNNKKITIWDADIEELL
tara:strand:+ start:2489 stop:3268 length:780 start_codon:yes stop_codon:yes gene_type:complete